MQETGSPAPDSYSMPYRQDHDPMAVRAQTVARVSRELPGYSTLADRLRENDKRQHELRVQLSPIETAQPTVKNLFDESRRTTLDAEDRRASRDQLDTLNPEYWPLRNVEEALKRMGDRDKATMAAMIDRAHHLITRLYDLHPQRFAAMPATEFMAVAGQLTVLETEVDKMTLATMDLTGALRAVGQKLHDPSVSDIDAVAHRTDETLRALQHVLSEGEYAAVSAEYKDIDLSSMTANDFYRRAQAALECAKPFVYEREVAAKQRVDDFIAQQKPQQQEAAA